MSMVSEADAAAQLARLPNTEMATEPCRWLISLDFDGTLWNELETPPLSPAFFELMQAWRAQGVRWGINTGRTLSYFLSDYLQHAPCMPDFICTCERFVYVADAQGRLQPLVGHNAAARDAAADLRRWMPPLLHAELERIRKEYPHWQWVLAADDPLSVETADGETMDMLAEQLEELMEEHPMVSMQRAGRYMRLADARFNKGSALAHVLQEWELLPQYLLMAGDGHNDVDAFRRFPTAFCAAPAGAHAEVCAWLRRHGGHISPQTGVLELLQTWHQQVVLV